MGYINLTGDSDGDLHTAAMHNAKFGAIASVLNGNIDADNLANPYSRTSFHFHCTGVQAAITNEFYGLSSMTIGTISSANGSSTAGSVNCLKASWIKVPFSMVITDVVLIAQENASLTPGEDYTIELQKSASLNGTYASIANVDYDFSGALASSPVEQSLAITTTTVTANEYIRLVLQNPNPFTTPQYPNAFSVMVYGKTNHVA